MGKKKSKKKKERMQTKPLMKVLSASLARSYPLLRLTVTKPIGYMHIVITFADHKVDWG